MLRTMYLQIMGYIVQIIISSSSTIALSDGAQPPGSIILPAAPSNGVKMFVGLLPLPVEVPDGDVVTRPSTVKKFAAIGETTLFLVANAAKSKLILSCTVGKSEACTVKLAGW